MRRKSTYLIFAVLVLSMVGTTSAVYVKVDFGPGTAMSGWTEWNATSGSKSVDGVDFTLANSNMPAEPRLRELVGGSSDDLTYDCISCEDEGSGTKTYTLTITNLSNGEYQLVTYFNKHFSGWECTQQVKVDGILKAGPGDAPFQQDMANCLQLTATFSVTGGSSQVVTVDWEETSSNGGPFISGFELVSQGPLVSFESASSSGSETVSPVQIPVVLSDAEAGQTYTVDYTVIGGTALGGGDDYTLAAGTLTFLPDSTIEYISVDIVDDGQPEDDETIEIELSSPAGPDVQLGEIRQHTFTIIDSSPTVEFDLGGGSGMESVSLVYVQVGLSAPAEEEVTVDYAVIGGTAEGGGVDYTLEPGTLVFSPDDTTATITLDIVADSNDQEPYETIIIELSNPTNANLGITSQYTYSILSQLLCLKVDLVLTQCEDPNQQIIPGTAKPGWWPWVVRGTDMYMHDAAWERGENGQGPPPDTNGIGGSGVHVAITCGSEGNGGFHVHGMCRDNLGGDGCPTGAPDGDPIANGWFHNIDWGGEKTGDVLMRINGLPAGEYELISYHNHWEPCTQETRNCLDCTSNMPNMPRVSAQSLPTDSLGYNFGFEFGTGMGVTPIQDACDVDVSCVTSDDDVSTSTIRFFTDGSDVLVIYDGGDNTYPDPARPKREGSKGILNAFILQMVAPPETAWGPSPVDGIENVSPDVVLGWEVGENAVWHDVYLGTDWDNVNDANNSSTEYKGSQILEDYTYDPCGLLELEKTYYWRIDEVKDVNNIYKGNIWSFTVYRAKASGPSPTNGTEDVAQDVELGWSPSFPAASHDVYLGTNCDDVDDANKSSSEYKGSQSLEDGTYDPCGPLGLDKTYYWRIDEVNEALSGGLWKGDVWYFTTINYVVVDDMEEYTEGFDSEYPITRFTGSYGWDCVFTNETSSLLQLQTDTPVCGNQSMLYFYENSYDYGQGYYSEVSNHFVLAPCDWTALDVKILSLWFYGDPSNDANETEQMYVGLEDSSGAGSYVEVRYPIEDMNDIKTEEWQEWNIALSDFADVNTASVEKLYIGFGQRGSSAPGGYGTVHFDDIRLYPAKCIPAYGPAGDFTGDCFVGFQDYAILGNQWLQSPGSPSADIAPESPDGVVNWLDLAVLADSWLKKELWPPQ